MTAAASEIKVGKLCRDFTGAEVTLVREADKPTRLSFPASSETPVERWFGTEVLSATTRAPCAWTA
jgi:hypothetical protein